MALSVVLVLLAVHYATPDIIFPGTPPPVKPVFPETPEPPPAKPASMDHPLDLAFIMDTTGSMGSYIHSAKENINKIVDEIIQTSRSKVRLSLVEYRDHAPQEQSFVTQSHDFTESVENMKSWLTDAKARGGGDTPEAVADALYDITKLSWNEESTKIAILISDAPPHALDPSSDSSFQNGCPDRHDPMDVVRKIAKLGITLYSAGVEPSINPYKDFFATLAYITGGQYVPMRDPRQLINAIIGGAQEELSLQNFTKEVEIEIEQAMANHENHGVAYDENEITRSVYERLAARGATSTHLVKNKKELKGPTKLTRKLSKAKTMADVRAKMGKKIKRIKSKPYSGRKFRGPSVYAMEEIPRMESAVAFSDDTPRMMPRISPKRKSKLKDRKFKRIGKSKSSKRKSKGSKGAYSTKESAVSRDQIDRLVKKLSSKLRGS